MQNVPIARPASQEERERLRATFDAKIHEYAQNGYRVVSRTDLTAQLVRPKQFSLFWSLAWLLVFGVGILVYLFYYVAKPDEQVYLFMAKDGTVMRS